jgi:hypothetical protein
MKSMDKNRAIYLFMKLAPMEANNSTSEARA